MANKYVRPSAAHGGANNGTSYADAWQGWSAISWAAISPGDTLYLCGTFAPNGGNMLSGKAGAAGNPIVFSGGYEPDPGIVNAVTNHMLGLAHNYLTATDLEFNPAAGVAVAVQGVAVTGVTIKNCMFHGAGASIDVPLLSIVTAVNTQSYVDLTITNNTFTGGQRSGIQWGASGGAGFINTVTRCTITDNDFIGFAANNNGACISFRHLAASDGNEDACRISDLIIDRNTFTDCSGLAIQVVGKGAHETPVYIDGWSGIKIRGNVIKRQKYPVYPVAGRPYADGWQTGGGIAVASFGLSQTPGFGHNEIAHNDFDGLQGLTGGVNFFTGTYHIHHNKLRNIVTRADRVDGNGILADFGDHDCVVEHNYVYNCPGTDAYINSGMAYGAYAHSNVVFRNNKSIKSKHGVMLIGSVSDGTGEAEVIGNTLLECRTSGLYMASSNKSNMTKVQNNLFGGTGIAEGVKGAPDTSHGYSVWSTDGEALGVESNNAFNDFQHGTWNGGTSGDYALSGTTLIDATSEELVAAGAQLGVMLDYSGATRWMPPTIGADEYVRPRPTRMLP